MGNTCCEKDFEAVKSDTQDFRKKRLEFLPGFIFGPLVRVHQEPRSNNCFLLNTSTEHTRDAIST